MSSSQKEELQAGFRNGDTAAFRVRCKAVLLKSEGKKAEEIAGILDCCVPSVFNWMKRFRENGIEGLRTKTGVQRRKPALTASDLPLIKEKVAKHRQRIKLAKAEWEAETGRTVGYSTLRHFLASMAQDISE